MATVLSPSSQITWFSQLGWIRKCGSRNMPGLSTATEFYYDMKNNCKVIFLERGTFSVLWESLWETKWMTWESKSLRHERASLSGVLVTMAVRRKMKPGVFHERKLQKLAFLQWKMKERKKKKEKWEKKERETGEGEKERRNGGRMEGRKEAKKPEMKLKGVKLK